MKSDILLIASNFFLIGLFVGAQWYLHVWGCISIACILFVTWQAWQRLSADLAHFRT